MFIDTILYMDLPLSEIAKKFSTTVEKGHREWYENMDKDKWYLNKKWNYKNKDDIEYCMNDCNILLEFILKYNKFILDVYNDIYEEGDWALVKSSISAIFIIFFFIEYF